MQFHLKEAQFTVMPKYNINYEISCNAFGDDVLKLQLCVYLSVANISSA